MIRCLFHFLDQTLYTGNLCTVGGHSYRSSARSLIGKGIEGGASFIAGGGFARGDIDLRASCLEKAMASLSAGIHGDKLRQGG